MDKVYWKHREFIEFCFKNEAKIKKGIVEYRLDPNIPRSIGHGSGISKPTEIQAINNVTPIKSILLDGATVPYPELWLRVVYLVKAHFNYKQGGTLYWLRYHEKYTRSETLLTMKISKTRYHQLIIEIIDYAISKALELYLIKESEE